MARMTAEKKKISTFAHAKENKSLQNVVRQEPASSVKAKNEQVRGLLCASTPKLAKLFRSEVDKLETCGVARRKY